MHNYKIHKIINYINNNKLEIIFKSQESLHQAKFIKIPSNSIKTNSLTNNNNTIKAVVILNNIKIINNTNNIINKDNNKLIY